MTQETTKDKTEEKHNMEPVEETSNNVDMDATDETMQPRKRLVLPGDEQKKLPPLQIVKPSTKNVGKSLLTLLHPLLRWNNAQNPMLLRTPQNSTKYATKNLYSPRNKEFTGAKRHGTPIKKNSSSESPRTLATT